MHTVRQDLWTAISATHIIKRILTVEVNGGSDSLSKGSIAILINIRPQLRLNISNDDPLYVDWIEKC